LARARHEAWARRLENALGIDPGRIGHLPAAARPAVGRDPGSPLVPAGSARSAPLRVTGNRRITFSFDPEGAKDVDLEDYQ
jgi:hypothetical protein